MALVRSSAVLVLIVFLSMRCKGVQGADFQGEYFFIVDASYKISATDFKKQIDFVITMIRDLHIDQSVTRGSLVTYGKKASTEFGINFFHSQGEIIKAVSMATQLEGNGGTDLAIREMFSLLKVHGRPGVPHVAIVFLHDAPSSRKATIEQAQIAHSRGIIMFGVSIGNEVDDKFLKSIASQPELIFRVDSLTNIGSIRSDMKKKIHRQLNLWTPPTPVHKPPPTTKAIDIKPSQNRIEADYIFVVDASVKISASDFKKQLSFVNDVIRDLAINSKVSRCALLTFGSRARTDFEFLSFGSRTEISNAIFKVTQLEGSGGTDHAIQQMLALLEKRDKPDIPVTAVIFIREKSTNVQTTIEEAQLAHNKGVIIFAVAIGNDVDEKFLSSIVTETKFIFKVESYESLKIIQYNITEITKITVKSWTRKLPMPTIKSTLALTKVPSTSSTTEKATTLPTTSSTTEKVTTLPTTSSTTEKATTTTEEAKIPTISPTIKASEIHDNNGVQLKFDIVFAVDVSTTISDLDLLNQRSFLKLVIRNLGIDQSQVRCGIVTFGSQIRTFLELSTYQNQLKIMDIIASVNKMEGSGGTDLSLRRMLTMFEVSGRIGVSWIGVLFTHQKSNDVKATTDAADAARRKGINLFVVAIGSEVDDQEINAVSSGFEFVLKVVSYQYLVLLSFSWTRKVREVAEHGVQQPQHTTPANIVKGEIKADYIFVVDVSVAISITELTAQLTFLNSVIGNIGIDQNGSRCGLVTYGGTSMKEFGFASYHRREEIITAVSKVTRIEGSGGTDLALRRMLTITKETRSESSRVAYVFMHGKSRNMTATGELADIARRMGISLFAVGIGSQVDEREITLIASKKEFTFKVNSYVELNGILTRLTEETNQVVTHYEHSSKSSTAEGSWTESVCRKTKPADIIFSLPTSNIDYQQKKQGFKFLEAMVRHQDSGLGPTHFGLAPCHCACESLDGVSLSDGLDREKISRFVDKLMKSEQPNELTNALSTLRGRFGPHKDGETAKIALFVLNRGSVRMTTAALNEARLLKEKGIRIYLIGVGERPSNDRSDDLISLASCFDCATNVDTYEHLLNVVEKIASNLVKDLCVGYAN